MNLVAQKVSALPRCSDDEAAKRAIEELSGKEFAGRALVIKEARPRA